MKYPIYSYRDLKVGYAPPQCDQSDQAAIRGFSFAINNHDSMMNFSPKDFDLYKVGIFDTETGQIESCTPDMIASGVAVFCEVDK